MNGEQCLRCGHCVVWISHAAAAWRQPSSDHMQRGYLCALLTDMSDLSPHTWRPWCIQWCCRTKCTCKPLTTWPIASSLLANRRPRRRRFSWIIARLQQLRLRLQVHWRHTIAPSVSPSKSNKYAVTGWRCRYNRPYLRPWDGPVGAAEWVGRKYLCLVGRWWVSLVNIRSNLHVIATSLIWLVNALHKISRQIT